MKPLLLSAALASAVLAGCSMEPTYQRPDMPVPNQYPASSGSAAIVPNSTTPVDAAEMDWHDFFRDPVLQRLIDIALANNNSLKAAAANMQAARANYGVARANLFPELDANGSASRERLPALTQSPGVGAIGPTENTTNNASVFNTYQVQAGLTSYELDFFGHQRAIAHEQGDLAKASEADYASERIALIGEVANAYLSLTADCALLHLAQQTEQDQQQHADVMKKAFHDGGVSEFDMRRSQTQVDSAQVDEQALQIRIAKDMDALAVLIGRQPLTAYAQARPWQAPLLMDVPAGLPSTLLDRRPDIIAAEARLQAANADIGRARAAFFPTIALTAVLGTLSGGVSDLFTRSSGAWTTGVTGSVPLLDWGKNKNNLKASKEGKEEAIANYQGAVQQAFREVADSLATRDHIVPEIQAQQKLVDQSQRVYDISKVRFKDGLDDYISQQSAQQQLYQAQQKLVQMQLDQAVNQVNLYKALGGGWKTGQPAPQQTASATTAAPRAVASR